MKAIFRGVEEFGKSKKFGNRIKSRLKVAIEGTGLIERGTGFFM